MNDILLELVARSRYIFAVGGGWRAGEVAGRDWTREAGKRDHGRAEKSLGVTYSSQNPNPN